MLKKIKKLNGVIRCPFKVGQVVTWRGQESVRFYEPIKRITEPQSGNFVLWTNNDFPIGYKEVRALKVYIAARYSRKEEMKEQVAKLQDNGFEVTSTWMTETHDGSVQLADISPVALLSYARRDLKEVDDADVLLFYSESDQSYNRRGGRHVEYGYALAKDKLIIVVGPYENIFHYAVHHFKTTEAAIAWLKE